MQWSRINYSLKIAHKLNGANYNKIIELNNNMVLLSFVNIFLLSFFFHHESQLHMCVCAVCIYDQGYV